MKRTIRAVHLTYVSNGSGAGIHDVMMGTVDFAGTDGPLNKTQMLDFSTHRNCEVLHFPTALGADVPIYNVPGITQVLNFTPQALAGIYLGTITKWNDPQIAKPNPNVSLCPTTKLWLSIGKTEAAPPTCGPTTCESQLRIGSSASDTGFRSFGRSESPPKATKALSKAVAHTPYSIGYSELTYAVRNRLPYGSVANRSGQFIKANLASVTRGGGERRRQNA